MKKERVSCFDVVEGTLTFLFPYHRFLVNYILRVSCFDVYGMKGITLSSF
jgi:hypothetical protein